MKKNSLKKEDGSLAAQKEAESSTSSRSGSEKEEEKRTGKRVEMLGHLALGMSKDFHQMLEYILMNCDLILKKVRPLGPLTEQLLQIKRTAEKGADLVSRILEFSEEKAPSSSLVHINSAISQIAKTLQPLLGDQIKINYNLAPNLSPIHFDQGELEEILVNFAVHSKNWSVRGGAVIFETSVLNTDPGPQKGPDTAAAFVLLTMKFLPFASDREIGLPLSFHEDIFTSPTFLEHLTRKGGRVAMENRGPKGGIIKIYFPTASAEIPATAPHHQAETDQTMGSTMGTEGIPKETILLAEDQDNLRHLLREILESQGYLVLTAKHVYEVLSIFNQKKNNIDLLLTDVIMPEMTGPELTRQIHTLGKQIKVLYMSGYPDAVVSQNFTTEDSQEMKIQRDHNFLQKPFNPEDLLEKIRRVLSAKMAQ